MRITRILPLLLCSPAFACAGDAGRPLSSESLARIDEGRALLDAGDAREAEAVFARVAEEDGGSARTRVWVLRAWIDQGRSDESLAAIEELERSGGAGPDVDYLYGAAFARRAEAALAGGEADAQTANLFVDAARLLDGALASDPGRYRDAFPILARAAFQAGELDVARRAADGAVAAYPESAASWFSRGQVALAQLSAAESGGPGGERADELWRDATSSFERALELHGSPSTDAAAWTLAQSAIGLAQARLWRAQRAAATEAFAAAIEWAPDALDYPRTAELLAGPTDESEAPAGFRAALEAGLARFEARAGKGDPRAATPLWWLGWARFADADWQRSEEAFAGCMGLAPGITNGWLYIALARHYRRDEVGALAALSTGWEADPRTMVATASVLGGGVRALELMIAWCATQEPARNREAALVADLLAQAFPEEPRHWNNLGLFLRDAGERQEIEARLGRGPKPDPAQLAELYERSFAAYERGLALVPDDPQFLNDTALMLQYHLGRDLERAEAMYRRAAERVGELLAAGEADEQRRAVLEQARIDANENLRLLLEARAEATAAAAGG